MKYLLFFIFASFSLITTAFCQSGEKENRSVGIISSDNELTNFLNQIEEEFNLEFAYDSNIRLSGINRNYQKKSSIRDMLTEIFEPGDIEFVIQDRTILLRNKKQMIKPVHISGVITDMTDGEPLPYSGLTDSFGKQFFSDSLGRFRLTYTEGALPESIRFSYMGYGTCILPIGHNETKMQIRLSRKAQRIPTINISSTMLPDIYPSYQEVSNIETLSLPSSIVAGDILRNVQLLPGVAAHKDISSAIEIRGAEAYETMVNLDGIVIYNPYHFYNMFSSVNSEYIHSSKLFKNDLPLEYTSKTGGLLAIKTKDLSNPEFNMSGSVDLFHASASIEIPVANNTGLLIAGRTSYTDLSNAGFFKTVSGTSDKNNIEELRSNLIQQLDPSFNFYDLNAKFQTQFGKNNVLDFNVFASKDNFDNTHVINKVNNKNITAYLFDYSDRTQWGNFGLSGNYKFKPYKNHRSKIILQYSSSETSNRFRYLNELSTRSTAKRFSFENHLTNKISDLHLNITDRFSTRSGGKITLGLEVGTYSTYSQINSDSSEIFNQERAENTYSVFQSYSRKVLNTDWKIGGRINYLGKKQEWLFDPQLSFRNRNMSIPGEIYGSIGLSHQFLTQLSYENLLGQVYDFWLLTDDEFPVLQSFNTMMGYHIKKETLVFNTELYFKYKTGITEFALINPGLPASNEILDEYFMFFTGEGLVLGMDIMLQKTFGPYSTQMSYTLSTQKNSFENIFKGQFYPDNDHRTHQLKWLNNLDISAFSLFANTIFSSGKPYLDVSKLENKKSRKELNPDKYLEYLPPYFRIDLGIQYKPTKLKDKMSIGLSVFNLLNRQNVYSVQYIKPVGVPNQNNQDFIPAGAESTLLDRTLNLNLRFRF